MESKNLKRMNLINISEAYNFDTRRSHSALQLPGKGWKTNYINVVETIITHPPVITIDRWYVYHSQMGSLSLV